MPIHRRARSSRSITIERSLAFSRGIADNNDRATTLTPRGNLNPVVRLETIRATPTTVPDHKDGTAMPEYCSPRTLQPMRTEMAASVAYPTATPILAPIAPTNLTRKKLILRVATDQTPLRNSPSHILPTPVM